jgi:hypothetical protein
MEVLAVEPTRLRPLQEPQANLLAAAEEEEGLQSQAARQQQAEQEAVALSS